jgi:hypothetical protein
MPRKMRGTLHHINLLEKLISMTARNQAIFNILGGGIGNPNSRLPFIQVTIASCPCRTASS